jgi:predicted nucleotidyltransferase
MRWHQIKLVARLKGQKNVVLRFNLSQTKKKLEEAKINWAVFAGAAAYYYGSRRKINDIDILVEADKLAKAKSVLEDIDTSKIDVVARCKILTSEGTYFFSMDDEMMERVRWRRLFGIFVRMISVEDNIAFKAITQRGEDKDKHDLEDICCMIEDRKIDLDYLKRRIQKCHASERAMPILRCLIPYLK